MAEYKKFENRIEQYDEPAALYRRDPGLSEGGYQRPYLYVRWGNEPYVLVGLETAFDKTSIPGTIYNGLATGCYISPSIDATQLRAEVDERVIPILEEMNLNREEFWDGSNFRGRAIDKDLDYQIEGRLYGALGELSELTEQEVDKSVVRDIKMWDGKDIYILQGMLIELYDSEIIDSEDIPVDEKYREQVEILRERGVVVYGCDKNGEYLNEDWKVREISKGV